MFDLPTTITIGSKKYPIRNRGDFRMVLDCFEALNDSDLDDTGKVLTALIIFYDGLKYEADVVSTFGIDGLEAAVTEMYTFFNCGKTDVSGTTPYVLVDWNKDSQLIASAINATINKEVRAEPYVHWWTFMGYYMAVGQSVFATVVDIRKKLKSGKKLEKHEKEFKAQNPDYFVWESKTAQQKEEEEYFRMLWEG